MTFGRFFMRPEASVDYIALFESSHNEKGGGPALDLALASRTSTEGSAQADMVFGSRIAGTVMDADIGLKGGREIRVGEQISELVVAQDVGAIITNAVA